MPKAYSGKMREQVIAKVESGASRREAAEQLEISASSAVRWLQRWREHRAKTTREGESLRPAH
jgi:transposase